MVRFLKHLLVFFILAACFSAAGPLVFGAMEYTDDGILNDRLENQRWYINRTRYGPEQEADALSLVNATPGGSPDYDICEDTAGVNDFGTTTNAWAPWRASMPPVASNERMHTAADNHAFDLARILNLSHPTPTGSPFYATGINGISREAVEGYTNAIFGFFENLNYGARGSSGSFPDYGLQPEGVHTALMVDVFASNRGHRKAILNNVAREIGLGHMRTNVFNWQGGGFFWTIDFDVQDFGRQSTNHFFTGTLFYDQNSNGLYDVTEGRAGIEVHLWNGTNEAAFYDVSQTSGNFAVPINDLPDNEEVLVYLYNNSGSNTEVSIPFSWDDLATINLTNGQNYLLSSYVQPAGLTNIGFRNTHPVTPHTALTLTASGTEVEYRSMRNMAYITERASDLAGNDWYALTTNVPQQESVTVIDSNTSTQNFYRTWLRIDGYPH